NEIRPPGTLPRFVKGLSAAGVDKSFRWFVARGSTLCRREALEEGPARRWALIGGHLAPRWATYVYSCSSDQNLKRSFIGQGVKTRLTM
ncbi:MAG: hypothetical protein MUP14_02470, partial [Dehalococcoidia bacterium]|nr:hypothetical protein [Dehalococcoidia bacterium]